MDTAPDCLGADVPTETTIPMEPRVETTVSEESINSDEDSKNSQYDDDGDGDDLHDNEKAQPASPTSHIKKRSHDQLETEEERENGNIIPKLRRVSEPRYCQLYQPGTVWGIHDDSKRYDSKQVRTQWVKAEFAPGNGIINYVSREYLDKRPNLCRGQAGQLSSNGCIMLTWRLGNAPGTNRALFYVRDQLGPDFLLGNYLSQEFKLVNGGPSPSGQYRRRQPVASIYNRPTCRSHGSFDMPSDVNRWKSFLASTSEAELWGNKRTSETTMSGEGGQRPTKEVMVPNTMQWFLQRGSTVASWTFCAIGLSTSIVIISRFLYTGLAGSSSHVKFEGLFCIFVL